MLTALEYAEALAICKDWLEADDAVFVAFVGGTFVRLIGAGLKSAVPVAIFSSSRGHARRMHILAAIPVPAITTQVMLAHHPVPIVGKEVVDSVFIIVHSIRHDRRRLSVSCPYLENSSQLLRYWIVRKVNGFYFFTFRLLIVIFNVTWIIGLYI